MLKWKLIDQNNIPEDAMFLVMKKGYGSANLHKLNSSELKINKFFTHYILIDDLLSLPLENRLDKCDGCYSYHNGECIENTCYLDSPNRVK